MKRAITLFFLACLTFIFNSSSAQINLGNKLEEKAKQRLERKVDKTIDKGFDKTEEGVDKGARTATGKNAGKDGNSHDQDAQQDGGHSNAEEGTGTASPTAPSLKAYGRFDFLPGEKVVAMEDFQQDEIGDFPARWNTNTSGEVVTITGREGRWLKLSGKGIYYPEFLGVIPDNSTIEFSAAVLEKYGLTCKAITVHFVEDGPNLLKVNRRSRVSMGVHPDNGGYTQVEIHDKDGTEIMRNQRDQKQFVDDGSAPVVKVSVWRQKNRLRVYMNEEKVWDLPRAFQDGVNYRMILESGTCDASPFLGELRVAVGAPDTRNKLITEGRFVTSGILFDSGSDRIKAGSHGILKEIAGVLQENPSVRVNIIGHTDSDGDATKNLDLSKRRAASVKQALTAEFDIVADRIETDGMGASKPAVPNDTPQGKANNRRVEFVKL